MRRSNRIIYCARNIINNKSYIGWCTNFKERKARHIRSSELGSKTRFHNALRKYGSDYFEWFILFEDLNSQDDCKRMEMRMIALFDTYANGYNSTIGGDGGFTGHNSGQFKPGQKPWSTGRKLHYIDKLKSAHSGKKQSLITIEKRALQLRGRKYSEQHCRNIGISLYKRVAQYDLDDNLLAEYQSLKEATSKTGVNNISAVCHGKLLQAGGFKWKYS